MGPAALGRLGLGSRSPGELAAWAGRWAAFWLATVLVARRLAPMLEPTPAVAIVPGVLLLLALISARFPLIVLLALALVTGFYGTIHATTGLEWHVATQAALAGLWLATLHGIINRRDGLAPRLWPGALLLLTVVALALCWALLADSVVVGFEVWRERYWLMLAALLVAYFPPGRVNSVTIARVLLVAGAGGAAYAVLRWQIGASTEEKKYAVETAGAYTYLEGKLRPIGGIGDAHSLSSFMVPLVPLSLALLLTWRDRWRLLAGLVLAASALVIVITEVRTGLASAAVGVAVVLALVLAARSLGGHRFAAGYLAVILCVGIVGAVVTFEAGSPSQRSERFRTILAPEADPSFQVRIFRWKNALTSVEEKPFGHGPHSAEAGTRSGIRVRRPGENAVFAGDVVNSYLLIAHEQGFVFTVILIGTLLAILAALIARSLASPTSEGSIFAIAGAGTLTAFAFELNFESYYISIPTAVLAWMIIGLGMRQLSWRPTGEGEAAP